MGSRSVICSVRRPTDPYRGAIRVCPAECSSSSKLVPRHLPGWVEAEAVGVGVVLEDGQDDRSTRT